MDSGSVSCPPRPLILFALPLLEVQEEICKVRKFFICVAAYMASIVFLYRWTRLSSRREHVIYCPMECKA
jgi:hypothetical protein